MGTFCGHGNQTERQITIILAILNCPYPSNICTRLVILPQWFGDVIKKKYSFVLNLMLPWQPNKMAIGHKTHKLGRQSSNDHNYQYGSHHFNGFGENAV